MRYAEMHPGMYVVRTRELSWARMLSGNICYIVDVNPDENSLVMQMTKDCVPDGKKFKITKDGDDGHWHDTTDLVFEANSAIQPPQDMCMYASNAAANYRNFLGMRNIAPLDGEDAEGHLCLLGEEGPNGVVYSKVGYWVVAHDNGYYIAYQGYCEHVEEGTIRETTLKVLSLSPTRHFYPAEEIVNACSDAFREDVELSNQYSTKLIQEAIGDNGNDGISTLSEGNAVEMLTLGV